MVLKIFSYIFFALLFAIFAGCRTIPEGTAPAGPIVADPVQKSTLPDANAAVNHMVVALVMQCRPIADAGKDKPKVKNDFMFAPRQVNYVQMDVWRKLIKMNMLIPCYSGGIKPEYKLLSEIAVVKKTDTVTEKSYLWKMTLERNSDKKSVWHEQIEFVK